MDGTRSPGTRRDGGAQHMRVKVHCRVRPDASVSAEDAIVSVQRGAGVASGGAGTSAGDVVVLRGEEASWQFDSFLDERTSQGEAYEAVAAPIVSSVLAGYNGTIMAYGQTGSGKTHTMFGSQRDPGIVPRALGQIFAAAGEDAKSEISVAVSYVQIYNELLTDLLCPSEDCEHLLRQAAQGGAGRRAAIPSSAALSIREDPERGIVIDGLKSVLVGGVDEAMALVTEGEENRVRASTNLNASSSRSHACVIVEVKRRDPQHRRKLRLGKLILVDLAGSERVSKSLGEHVFSGVRFSEARAINVSLSALGNCVSALAKKKKHVPFRDAKLTRLLKDSLGGNSLTALVINVSADPGSQSETKSTLAFGSRAMAVTNTRVRINEEVDYQQLYSSVQADLDSRDDKIAELEIALQKTQIELGEARRAEHKQVAEKEMLAIQLRSIALGGDAAATIQAVQDEHRAALEAAEQRFASEVSAERAKAAAAQEEWYRIEYDLKAEREEHLRTCALLREKQQQLGDLEANHEERLADLMEELRAAAEKGDALAANLRNAFEERKLNLAKVAKLEAQLQEQREFADRGLQLMQTLTQRVEELERKRPPTSEQDTNEQDQQAEESSTSSSNASARSGKHRKRAGPRKQPRQQHQQHQRRGDGLDAPDEQDEQEGAEQQQQQQQQRAEREYEFEFELEPAEGPVRRAQQQHPHPHPYPHSHHKGQRLAALSPARRKNQSAEPEEDSRAYRKPRLPPAVKMPPVRATPFDYESVGGSNRAHSKKGRASATASILHF